MAATQAYRSAQVAEKSVCPDYRPAPPVLHRRQSQVTGRSEGSHLENARLGRRRSTARREEKITPMARQRPHTEYEPTALTENETRARRTTMVQPKSATSSSFCNEGLGPLANGRHRSSPYAYSNGSPAPRPGSGTPGLRSSSIAQTPRHTDKSYDDGLSVTYTEPQSYADRIKAESRNRSNRVSIRETQTDEEIIALARERQLLESQHQKIRERKSFFGSLQMLQKRETFNGPSSITYDSSLPPFNYADDPLLAPLPPPHDAAPPMSSLKPGIRPDRRTRAFLTSVKGQLKKLLRKASRAPSGLVTQRTEVEVHGDFVIDEDDSVGLHDSSVLTDPFVVHDSPVAVSRTGEELLISINNQSNASIDGESAADRSRVTSWTNSTTVGTSSTHADTTSTSVADEYGRIICDKSNPALRKKGSFFGRAVPNRLRKASRADLKSSRESQALFTALRDRILPQDEKVVQDESASSVASRTSSALSSLPFQKRAASLAPSINEKALTIRTVSRDSNPYQIQTMSPLVEASPEHDSAHDTADDRTPTANHYRTREKPRAVQADLPSPERIARRVQQSQARYKGALHTNSTASDGKITSAYDDDNNPYELPSLSHNPYADHEADTGGLPKHTRVTAPSTEARERLLSPSVYSRATDSASPHPLTPEHNGTKITVTSREIKRYDVSPPKYKPITAQSHVHASGDWRKWLSDEMTSLTGQDEVDSLEVPHNPGTSVTTSTCELPVRKRAVRNGSGSQRRASDTPSSDQISKGRGRPRASSRRSSYMNDRYPMIESSDNSSRRTSRKCSMASNAGTDTERSLQIPGSDDSRHSANDTVTSSKSGASKPLPKRHSLANLESLPDPKAASTSNA
jgi:hypothetical protein